MQTEQIIIEALIQELKKRNIGFAKQIGEPINTEELDRISVKYSFEPAFFGKKIAYIVTDYLREMTYISGHVYNVDLGNGIRGSNRSGSPRALPTIDQEEFLKYYGYKVIENKEIE